MDISGTQIIPCVTEIPNIKTRKFLDDEFRGKTLNNKYGTFLHDDIIDKPFGSKIVSRKGSGWFYALEPNPEIWCNALNTRTQIVDESDSSFLILNLDLYPGCKVVESGTGSGCMTLAIARSVAPNGHVYTFEYNSSRADNARQEFDRLGVGHLITVECRDVCAKVDHYGGGFGNLLDNSIDAVFLDLPEPWLVIPYAKRVLKPGSSICTYSPCIEQVARTVEEFRNHGFHSISMSEIRQRPFDARAVVIDNINLGSHNHTEVTFGVATEHFITEPSAEDCAAKKRRIDIAELNSDGSEFKPSFDFGEKFSSAKKNSEYMNHMESSHTSVGVLNENTVIFEGNTTNARCNLFDIPDFNNESTQRIMPSKLPPIQLKIARPVNTMKGHSAFLTVASSPT